jgi:hypothetical protein
VLCAEEILLLFIYTFFWGLLNSSTLCCNRSITYLFIISFLSRTLDFSLSFWAHGFNCGWPRPVSSRSAIQPGWSSTPTMVILTICFLLLIKLLSLGVLQQLLLGRVTTIVTWACYNNCDVKRSACSFLPCCKGNFLELRVWTCATGYWISYRLTSRLFYIFCKRIKNTAKATLPDLKRFSCLLTIIVRTSAGHCLLCLLSSAFYLHRPQSLQY